MGTAAANHPEPAKIMVLTMQHSQWDTTVRHYVDKEFGSDTFSIIHRTEMRQDLPGPSGSLKRRIEHGKGGLLGALVDLASKDTLLDAALLVFHRHSICGTKSNMEQVCCAYCSFVLLLPLKFKQQSHSCSVM
jgi:hypothetical protein